MKMILLNSDTRALQLNELTDFAQEWFEDSDTGKQKEDKMVGRPLVCLHSPYAPFEAYENSSVNRMHSCTFSGETKSSATFIHDCNNTRVANISVFFSSEACHKHWTAVSMSIIS
jgi:hypothetical protein